VSLVGGGDGSCGVQWEQASVCFVCVVVERDSDCGQRPGRVFHHATQQDPRQAA